MRRTLLIALIVVLAIPLAALAGTRGLGDGTLSIADARGKVIINARGAVIAQFDRGTVGITDRTPEDTAQAIVSGAEAERVIGDTVYYSGRDLRFRVIGGAYRIQIRASGIDLSAVGNGWVQLQGEGPLPGVFSFTEDCRTAAELCEELPLRLTRYKLGGERGRPQRERSE